MKPQKIEDAHNFRRETKNLGVSERAHNEYVAFINENYNIKLDDITNIDHINHKTAPSEATEKRK